MTAADHNNKVILVDKIVLRNPVTQQFEYLRPNSLQDTSAKAETTDGLTVSIYRPILSTNAMTKMDYVLSNGSYPVGDTFNVSITANSDAKLGVHIIGISMFEPDESGVSGLGSTVFVYVETTE